MADWSAALEEAYASAPADEYVVSTLELIHPAFVDGQNNADSVRVALDDQSWDLTYEDGAPLFGGQTKTFEPLAMEVSLPEQNDSGSFGYLNIALDNVPRDIWPKLQAAAKIRASAIVIYREWVATRVGTGEYSVSGPPDMIIDQLTMKVITATVLRMEGQANFVDLLNKNFPRMKFSRDAFPGLFGGN